MFEGILDDIRSIGDDPFAFLSSSTGKILTSAAGNAFTAGKAKEQKQKDSIKHFYNDINFKAPQEADVKPDDSEDFSRIEAEWMQRLQNFSGMTQPVKDSEVKMGSF